MWICGGYEAVTVTVAVGVGAAIVVTAAVISITQSEPYKEAVKEVSTQIDNKIQETKEKINETKEKIVESAIETVTTAFSKGKKERDGEGNPIPPGNQKQNPLGKGANAGPEDIGDPGDLGGKDFKPPEDPGPGGKVILAAAAATSIIDNTVIPSTDNNQNEDQNNSTEEAVFTKGK